MSEFNKAKCLRGAGALADMLHCIGEEDATDHDVVEIMTRCELDLRELLSFVLRRLADEQK